MTGGSALGTRRSTVAPAACWVERPLPRDATVSCRVRTNAFEVLLHSWRNHVCEHPLHDLARHRVRRGRIGPGKTGTREAVFLPLPPDRRGRIEIEQLGLSLSILMDSWRPTRRVGFAPGSKLNGASRWSPGRYDLHASLVIDRPRPVGEVTAIRLRVCLHPIAITKQQRNHMRLGNLVDS